MSVLNVATQLLPLRLQFVRNDAWTATQGQALGNGSIISAMEINVQLMDIQIRLVHELTALQASMQPTILTYPVMYSSPKVTNCCEPRSMLCCCTCRMSSDPFVSTASDRLDARHTMLLNPAKPHVILAKQEQFH